MCIPGLVPKGPSNSAAEAEAARQREAENARIARDKKKRLAARQGQAGAADLQSLVSFSAQQPASGSGRSFFSPTGGS